MPDSSKSFIEWIAKTLPELPISLKIKPSSRVPGGIDQVCSGAQEVLSFYLWSSEWTDANGVVQRSKNWLETKSSLRKLRAWLMEGLGQSSSEDYFSKACHAVIAWGGGARSGTRGAKALVLAKEADGSLREYFSAAKETLSLDNQGPISGIHEMNAMLVKIHALLSEDGLPIYDSRVAGCAGALVELYCRANGVIGREPELPSFPSTDSQRQISRLISNCTVTEAIRYSSADRAKKWASAAVGLGRLLRQVLIANQSLFGDVGSLPERMHALEAAMFMIGADLRSLRPAFASYSKSPIEWK